MYSNSTRCQRLPHHSARALSLLIAICTVLTFPLAAAGLSASPDRIVFESRSDAKTVTLEHEGKPLPASAINDWRLLVDQHDYNHMLTVEPADGAIAVSPTDQVEIGSYSLVVSTDFGDVAIAVFTPLSSVPESLENRAKAMEITVEELKSHLGISQEIGRERIELQLPPVYYVGQKLHTAIERAPGRTAAWTINGDPVLSSHDDGRFEYLFTEPGVYVVGYTEYEDGTEIASGYDVTSVIGEPPVKWTVITGARAEFSGPAGFNQYKWILDGMESGNDATFSHVFSNAGTHELIVRGATVEEDGTERFRQVTYLITVS